MKRSKHSLSNTKLLSMNMGSLVPIGLLEVLPGDSIQQSTGALVRCSPLLAPVMHATDVRIHHWFVPHRLVWEDWEDFITGGPDGNDASVFPTRTPGAYAVGSLADYLGIPPGTAGIAHSILPMRGYQLIWNEWYRDQDLQSPAVVSKASGNDTTTADGMQNCAWEKDYFTSARPWEQKGPSVTIPIGTSAPVTGNSVFFETGPTPGNRLMTRNIAGVNSPVAIAEAGSAGAGLEIRGDSLTADLSSATGVTVNDLREGLAIQRFEEARARYGSRYVEYLRFLGVKSSDARLQRPEFLGGGRQTIQFSEVLQTAEGTDPVGELRGHGIAALRSNRYRKFFEEHGYIFTLMSVRPKTIYGNGLFRTWNRRTKTDFWQRELEHIGQQQVLNKEVYMAHATPDGVFGYQDRYDEYRRQESSIAGEFRTSVLDFWHMARIFAASPALNSSFVTSVPTERIFAVPSQDVLYVHARHSIQARRLISSRGNSFIF